MSESCLQKYGQNYCVRLFSDMRRSIMINLSQLSREQLMIYFANANDQLLIAEKLTKQYKQLKSQIKSTVTSNDKLKKQILDSIRIAQDFANETGFSHATSWDSLKRNVGTTATVVGGIFCLKVQKGFITGLRIG